MATFPALVLALVLSGTAAMAAPGGWERAPALRHARAAHAVVSTGTALYALAGTGDGGAPVRAVERFDGQRWSDVAELPDAGLNAPAAVALDGRIYVIGGFETVTNVPTARVRVFSPQTRAWTEAAPLPAPRGGHAAVVLDGRIHVIGGGNSERTLADHDVYDPRTDRWTAAAPLPRSEGSPAATVFEGRLYAIGGRSGNRDFGDVDVYDPRTDTWSAGPPVSPRGTAGAVVACGAVTVVGGESQAAHASLGEVVRLDAHGWHAWPALPTPRNFARAVLLGGDLYVVGGSPTPEASHAGHGSTVVERLRLDCAARHMPAG